MASPARTNGPEPFAVVYEEYFDFLIEVAVYKFKVPRHEAQDVVQELFLTYWAVRHRVTDTRAWLIAGVCHASRGYWIRHHERRIEPIAMAPEATTDHEAFLREVSVRQIVEGLPARCKTILRLHYFEGATAREVAGHLGTTHKYAEKLIHQCLRKAFHAWMTCGATRPAPDDTLDHPADHRHMQPCERCNGQPPRSARGTESMPSGESIAANRQSSP